MLTQATDRPHQPEEKNPSISTHCPVCWHKRPHRRTVRDGLEILTCKKCGNEQHYTYTPCPPEEE